MTNLMDFIKAALPWIAIGLFAAVNASELGARFKARNIKIHFSKAALVSMVCFAAVAVMEFMDGDVNSAVTFLVIGMATFALSLLNYRKHIENKEE